MASLDTRKKIKDFIKAWQPYGEKTELKVNDKDRDKSFSNI